MRNSINKTDKYKGYSLDIDTSNEVFTLIDPNGTAIKSFDWGRVINTMIDDQYKDTNKRGEPRAPLSIKIKYTDDKGKAYESITDTIGGGGLYIESLYPLPAGNTISLEFTLPDRPKETIYADATITWVRQKFEHILYYPGMGVKFTKISEKDKGKLLRMINSLNELRGEKVRW